MYLLARQCILCKEAPLCNMESYIVPSGDRIGHRLSILRNGKRKWKRKLAKMEKLCGSYRNMFAHSTWNAANLYGGSLEAFSKRDKGENFHVEKPPA